MKKKFKVIIALSSILGLVVVSGLTTSYFLFLHRYHGKEIVDEFDKTNTFDINSVKTLTKEKGKDFVILNLADVQMCDLEDIKYMSKIKAEIDELVYNIKPDLITLTGDQTWSNENLISLTSLIGWMESYKIPWAPIFGNHDFGNGDNNAVLDCLKCCEYYENAKYSLFSRGPSNLGCYGNYAINIKEEDEIVKTLYMMDYGVNDDLTAKQVEWFDWVSEGIKKNNNDTYSDGMIFTHKPFNELFSALFNGEEVTIPSNLKKEIEIENNESLYEIAKTRNISDFVCGHEHWFHFCYKNEDNIRFTFSLKTGELGGYAEGDNFYLNGATYFTLRNGETSINDYFVNKEKYGLGKE